ncbi:MAG: C69 family dipeptidase [Bacteroidetes bacterium]|nr:C69 family dipeptidase [Bacteroidota bacterium]
MCDTFVALPKATTDGSLILSKNSDREPDEAQAIIHIPQKKNTEKTLQCTYISIPQVSETYECILSKPFQMWGAEMGVNAHGLAIGNEAVFTKVKFDKKKVGLTGMDLLRLALERCKNAKEAIDCITSLLATHGQNANGGYKNKNFYYHNSFIIADTKDAWVLETAGNEWALERVKDIRSISNKLSISTNADQLSSEAKTFAQQNKWWDGKSAFDFQKNYSDWLYTTVGRAAKRQACTMELGMKKNGQLTIADCISILQTHNIEESTFKPSKANTGSICMHRTSLLNPSSTTGSMIAKIRKQGAYTIWLTGTSMPCLSIYIPFFFGTNSMHKIPSPSATADNSLWWRAEKIHQWICKDYKKRKALINEERTALQHKFITQENELLSKDYTLQSLETFSSNCYAEYEELINRWSKLM